MADRIESGPAPNRQVDHFGDVLRRARPEAEVASGVTDGLGAAAKGMLVDAGAGEAGISATALKFAAESS